MRRLGLPAILLAALALAGCAKYEDEPKSEEGLSHSVEQALAKSNADDGGFSQVLEVNCRPRQDSDTHDCDASVRARAFVYRDRYAVTLGDDGCWTAKRESLGVMRGTGLDAQELDDPGELSGCVK